MQATATPTTSSAQAAAIESAGQTQDAIVRAEQCLYKALRRPQPRRERRWAEAVQAALIEAAAALRQHRLEVERDDGLYAEVRRDAPWTQPRIRQLRARLQRVESDICELQADVDRVIEGDTRPLASIRGDAERMLWLVRDLQNKEADIVYERFNEPAALD